MESLVNSKAQVHTTYPVYSGETNFNGKLNNFEKNLVLPIWQSLSIEILNKENFPKSTTNFERQEGTLMPIDSAFIGEYSKVRSFPKKNVITVIEQAKLAEVGIMERESVEKYLVKLEKNYGYNPFKLPDLLKEVYHTLKDPKYNIKENVSIEIGHFLDNEVPDLEGLSIVVKVPTNDPHVLSDIWENLNEGIDVETSGTENIFFVVKSRF